MEITFEADAYISRYTTIEEVLNGQRLPTVVSKDSDKSYWAEDGYTHIGSVTMTVDVKPTDQIALDKIEALKAKLQTVRAENQQRENAILDQISKLQALTFQAA
jgi:hypothetical protein